MTSGEAENRDGSSGRVPPYGFKLNPNDSSLLIPEPFEQKAIELIVEMGARDMSTAAIVRRMNDLFKSSARGERWYWTSVDKIRNRNY